MQYMHISVSYSRSLSPQGAFLGFVVANWSISDIIFSSVDRKRPAVVIHAGTSLSEELTT